MPDQWVDDLLKAPPLPRPEFRRVLREQVVDAWSQGDAGDHASRDRPRWVAAGVGGLVTALALGGLAVLVIDGNGPDDTPSQTGRPTVLSNDRSTMSTRENSQPSQASSAPAQSAVSNSLPGSDGALALPSADYYYLTASIGGLTFDVSDAPCIYVTYAGGEFPMLALFPYGSTYEPSTGLLKVPGLEAQELRIDEGTFEGGGGGISARSLRRQGVVFDLQGCRHPNGLLQVWGLTVQ